MRIERENHHKMFICTPRKNLVELHTHADYLKGLIECDVSITFFLQISGKMFLLKVAVFLVVVYNSWFEVVHYTNCL